MRVVGVLLVSVLFHSLWLPSAADLKIKVVDPQSAAVAGAQVSLLRPATKAEFWLRKLPPPKAWQSFRAPAAEPISIQVLAPGFAVETVDVSSQTEITVSLRLATASETVVVTATRTPVPGEDAGADVESLNAGTTDDHAADRGERRDAFSSRRGGERCGAARRAVFPVRARRRVAATTK